MKRAEKYAARIQDELDSLKQLVEGKHAYIGIRLLEASKALRNETQFAAMLGRLGFDAERLREYIELAQTRLERERLTRERLAVEYEQRRKRAEQEEAWRAASRAKWNEALNELLSKRASPAASEAESQRRREARQRAAEIWRQAEQREAERRERQKVREEIIRAGHRALAKKHHPDIGGSTEQMTELNRARDYLLSRGT
jgi:hypothetical protein